ncbi:hypothetical protein FPHYL_4000 [Fusarium phyllophilum]|uniref:Myb-like domain-containing protein n=1 Tax=Fusarium phyllophilum TaxID=47803 RepID=A0A8H5NHU6_9HYPO|nr:hypothetical protein FPHYL_4000 [Fusarium phyllophilum]
MVASASRSPGPLPVLLRVLQVLTREDQQRKYNNYKPALKRLDTIFAVQSRETPTPPVAELVAQFEEWPLSGAVLKRITEGSKTTFQLQFEWDPASYYGVDDSSSDDNLSNGSDFEYNSDHRDIDNEPRYQTFQRKKVQRRRWTTRDEDLLRRLKQDKLSDCDIANILKRTESGVKQHWDIIESTEV